MKILTVDVGTGTQDIYLYDSRLDIENGSKMVLPAPTMIAYRKLKEATRRGDTVVLTGVTMGGGPSQWAAEEHLKVGKKIYATPNAARTFNDDLEFVASLGIEIISEEEVGKLPESVNRLNFQDFDFTLIAETFSRFGVPLNDLAAVAIAVFDHGAAPPDYSDRQFRFDYIKECIHRKRQLDAFAFLADDVPPIMTRMLAVVETTKNIGVPVVLMDTAPAAVLGAMLDSKVMARENNLVANVGNFHTIAFHMGLDGIKGIFEHHTGFLDAKKIDGLLRALADTSLRHEEVFDDHGHGALVIDSQPFDIDEGEFGVVVTGPRRNLMRKSSLRPYFATPFGDMMITGCFGLLSATGELLPEFQEPIRASLVGGEGYGKPPWENE
jgi:uncharacterized protein (DUF1786 family)